MKPRRGSGAPRPVARAIGFLLTAGGASIASPAMIMAIGIFGLDALQELPVGARLVVTGVLALFLLAVSGLMAVSMARPHERASIHTALADSLDGFAAGTWVAALGVLGVLVYFSFPGARLFAWILLALTICVWLWFLPVGLRNLTRLTRAHSGATGVVLLMTVATQSVVILAVTLSGAALPRVAWTSLVVLGLAFYLFGLSLVIRRHLPFRRSDLTEDWHNTNCIVHGAASISGLAAVTSASLPKIVVTIIWLWAAIAFIAVEIGELSRARQRVSTYGWRTGLLVYDASQWARNFTFGMFFAFTLHLHRNAGAALSGPFLSALWTGIGDGGQYVVLGLLVVELAVLARASFQSPVSP